MNTKIGKQACTGKIIAIILASASAATPALATNYSWSSGGQYDNSAVSPLAPSELLSGDVLTITDGGYFAGLERLTTDSGSTVKWTGASLGLTGGALVTNDGVWNGDSSTSLTLDDAGTGGTFTNGATGLFETTGIGFLTVDTYGSLDFVNNGGTLSAASGATMLFTGNDFFYTNFNDGTKFGGTGNIVIGGDGAEFLGTQTFIAGSNVNFAAGFFVNEQSTTPGVTLKGNSTWSGGEFFGNFWTLTSGSTLTAVGNGGSNTKVLSNINFTNNGTIDWTTADSVSLEGTSTLTNNGTFLMTAATTLADGGDSDGGTFINNGKFVDNGGGAVTVNTYGSLYFQNNSAGIITATKASDSITFTGNDFVQTTFANNSVFNGAGTIAIAGDGATFTGAQNIASGTHFVFADGFYIASTAGATLNGVALWTGGDFNSSGPWTLAKGSTLIAESNGGTNSKALDAANFINNGTINWATADSLLFESDSTLTNNGTFLMTAPTTIADGSNGGVFINNGKFVNTGGGIVTVATGTALYFQNNSAGIITATKTTDSIVFTGNDFIQTTFADNSVFNGAGTIAIAGDGATFTGAQNIASGTHFVFADGFYIASTAGASLNGTAYWTGGQFNSSGPWTLAAGSTLIAESNGGTNSKGLDAADFINNGTIQWTTDDDVYLESTSTLTNNGTFLMTAPTTLTDGSYGGTFANNGAFVNTGGGGVTVDTGTAVYFHNNSGGVITATKATDSITFTGSNYQQTTFATNSIYSGAGTIVIAGDGATFTGTQKVASGTDLTFAAGFFVTDSGGATLSGVANWTGGEFYGDSWNIAAGSTLNVATSIGANSKVFLATNFNNNGTLNWATADNIVLESGTVITNNGAFNISQNASFADGGFGGSLVNNGVLTKTGGTGTTSVAATGTFTGLVNNGVTQVNSGTIQLGGAFTNPGTLAGTGTFALGSIIAEGTLFNNGHISPGVYKGAPGALALTGFYVQGASGFLDIGATGSANSLFNVGGSATLAGTVDVNCIGTCTYSKGTELLILTATNGFNGNFTTITQSGFNGTNDFSLLQSGDNEYLVLDANVTAAVPEPSTYALMLAGFGVLYYRTRRRQVMSHRR